MDTILLTLHFVSILEVYSVLVHFLLLLKKGSFNFFG